ncbi:thioredoxin [Candidatus Microgenomates bacterium]|nr:thioredoxin [Candidatus Microgenomates bacterium]
MKVSFTDQNFEEAVLKAALPVLVDFRADWCGPCRLLDPLLEELAPQYEGKVVFGSLDVDANQQTAMKYGVMSIPTVLVFKNGQVVKQMVGYQGKEKIIAELTSVL